MVSTQIKSEVNVTMLQEKLDAIDEAVENEKKKSRDCKSAIKQRIDSLLEVLNGETEENSEEEDLDLGGNNADGK